MIAFLILTLLYFVYLHGILPQVPFDPSQVVLLWCLKWVLLFFIGLTFARAFCRYYRLRRLPAVLLAVLAVVFVLATLFTAAQMLQYTLDFLPTWLTGKPDTLTLDLREQPDHSALLQRTIHASCASFVWDS